jgi:hypothetical protein
VINPKQGFDLAFAAACEARDFETAESHLGHAIEDMYQLYELAKMSSSKADRTARDVALVKVERGQTAAAVVWARKYRFHDCVEVSQVADLFSDYYTNLYGVLAWRPRCDFTTQDDDGRGWHLFYDTCLQDRPVLDTLQDAAKALEVLVTSMNPSNLSSA